MTIEEQAKAANKALFEFYGGKSPSPWREWWDDLRWRSRSLRCVWFYLEHLPRIGIGRIEIVGERRWASWIFGPIKVEQCDGIWLFGRHLVDRRMDFIAPYFPVGMRTAVKQYWVEIDERLKGYGEWEKYKDSPKQEKVNRVVELMKADGTY